MAERGTRAEIDLGELEKLAALHPTDNELACWFGVSTKTIERRKSEPDFATALERGLAKGKLNLRRIQLKMAETNAAMAIFLGKNMLGQADQVMHSMDVLVSVMIPSALEEPGQVIDIEATR